MIGFFGVCYLFLTCIEIVSSNRCFLYTIKALRVILSIDVI